MSLHFDLVVEFAVELVTNSLQYIDQASLVLNHDVVSTLAIKAAANRAGVGSWELARCYSRSTLAA